MKKGLFSRIVGLCILLISTGAYSEDLPDKSAYGINQNIAMPMAKDLPQQVLEKYAEGSSRHNSCRFNINLLNKDFYKRLLVISSYSQRGGILVKNQIEIFLQAYLHLSLLNTTPKC